MEVGVRVHELGGHCAESDALFARASVRARVCVCVCVWVCVCMYVCVRKCVHARASGDVQVITCVGCTRAFLRALIVSVV